MPWTGIAYVTSGITLVAFVIATGAWVLRNNILGVQRRIQLAPESERTALVEKTLEFFAVDTSTLSSNQRYRLAVRQIEARAARFRVLAVVVSLVTIIVGVVAAVAVVMERPGKISASNEGVTLPQTLSSSHVVALVREDFDDRDEDTDPTVLEVFPGIRIHYRNFANAKAEIRVLFDGYPPVDKPLKRFEAGLFKGGSHIVSIKPLYFSSKGAVISCDANSPPSPLQQVSLIRENFKDTKSDPTWLQIQDGMLAKYIGTVNGKARMQLSLNGREETVELQRGETKTVYVGAREISLKPTYFSEQGEQLRVSTK